MDKLQISYHLNYWDGMISGVCLYNGVKCYFDTIDEVYEENYMPDEQWLKYCEDANKNGLEIYEEDRTDIKWWRIFAIYETPDDVIKRLDRNHRIFEKYVSKRSSYDMNGKRINEDVEKYNPILYDIFCKKDPEINKDNWKILEKFE